jgi:hypothetical protein
VDPGLSGFSLCLLWRDISEGGGKPLTIVVSFDAGEPDLIGPFDRKIAVEPIGGKMDTSDISDVLKGANRDGCPWYTPGIAAGFVPGCHDDA